MKHQSSLLARVARLLKAAKLRVSAACVEDINWRPSRALDQSLVTTLAGGDWIRNAQNLLITGATGCGKTWLGCALAHQAARSGFSVLYVRPPLKQVYQWPTRHNP